MREIQGSLLRIQIEGLKQLGNYIQWAIVSHSCILERCQDLMQMTQTIMQFNMLEKIGVGNTKVAAMINAVKQIIEEF